MSTSRFSQRVSTSYFFPVLYVGLIAICSSFITRLLLLIKSAAGVDWNIANIAGIFGIGLFYDLVVASYFMIPLLLHLWWMNDKSYSGNRRWIVILGFTGIFLLLFFTELVPKDFNADLKKVVIGYFVLRLLIYTLLMYKGENFRHKWRKIILFIDLFIITYVLLFNAISEWFFWDEFSTRYNFIAVDYLVYTTEVIGNIKESYPVGWLLAGVFALTFAVVYSIRRKAWNSLEQRPPFIKRSLYAMAFLIIPLTGFLFANSQLRKFSNNEYVNELAGNGIFEFGTAFWNNELDYFKFYQTLPDKEAFTILRKQLEQPNSTYTTDDVFNIERMISYDQPEKHMNVVLISVESLSASFMKAFGNQEGITPQLDSLASESLFFTNLYASGTRTVRGLEALALSIPPTPGQSTVKRPANEGLFSMGSILRSKGYTTQYIYGGYGYFDNMNYFFSNNDYEVVDRSALLPEQIHYANIWGVADEDLFTLSLQEMDKNYSSGKPFFAQVMTVSNHRPYTYPEGRIDIPPTTKRREGAVKYTDYAIGKFLKEARQKPWFSNTIFVIVADHCAGTSGKSSLPVIGYHIPMLIYSPGNIQPQKIERLTAQIDIPPTILGLLKMDYKTKFFGQDVFASYPGSERAFISTYQGLGCLVDGKLVIQSPVKKVEGFIPDFSSGTNVKAVLPDSLIKQAISYYQCASWLLKNRKYTSK